MTTTPTLTSDGTGTRDQTGDIVLYSYIGGSKWGREGHTPPPPPPGRPNSFNFMQFLENLAKMCVHALSPGGFTPVPGEILDPPLSYVPLFLRLNKIKVKRGDLLVGLKS